MPRFSLLLLPMAGIATLTAVALTYAAVAADRRMTVVMAAAAGTTFLMSGLLTAVTGDDRTRRKLRFATVAATALAATVFVARAF